MPDDIQNMVNALVPLRMRTLGGALGRTAQHLYNLPQRAIESAGQMAQTGEYNPAPFGDIMMQGAAGGMPWAPRGAMGAFGGASKIPGKQGNLKLKKLSNEEVFGPDPDDWPTNESMHEFQIQNAEGQKIGELSGNEQNEGRHFHVTGIYGRLPGVEGPTYRDFFDDPTGEYRSAHANTWGTGNTRSIIKALKGEFPKLESISGWRVSGARKRAAVQRGPFEEVPRESAYLKLPGVKQTGGTVMGDIVPDLKDSEQHHMTPMEYVRYHGGPENMEWLRQEVLDAVQPHLPPNVKLPRSRSRDYGDYDEPEPSPEPSPWRPAPYED